MYNKIFSLNNNTWNTVLARYIGGIFVASNLSGGFHGLLKQWWEYYSKSTNDVLLISENDKVKNELSDLYKNWNIKTLDLYFELTDGKPDFIGNICDNTIIEKFDLSEKFDLIINQAMLEHVYDPFGAMGVMCKCLKTGGHLITHTHGQNMHYHQYPKDYMRFMIDWWYDLPERIEGIKLVEFFEDDERINVFSCYERIL